MASQPQIQTQSMYQPVYRNFMDSKEDTLPYFYSTDNWRGQIKAILLSKDNFSLNEARKFVKKRLPEAELLPHTNSPKTMGLYYVFTLKCVNIEDKKLISIDSSKEGLSYLIASED